MDQIISYYLPLAVIFVISIGVHEFAHAWASNRLGDPTPKMMGRLTPNPLVHIDLLGLVMIFVIGFGWGKPVLTNPNYYRNPLRDEFLVAMAGPFSNFVLMIISIIVVQLFMVFGMADTFVQIFWVQFGIVNCALMIFNLLPLPPLDGWRFVKVLFPQGATKMQMFTYQNIMITFVLLFVLSRFIAPLISSLVMDVYGFVSGLFFALFVLW